MPAAVRFIGLQFAGALVLLLAAGVFGNAEGTLCGFFGVILWMAVSLWLFRFGWWLRLIFGRPILVERRRRITMLLGLATLGLSTAAAILSHEFWRLNVNPDTAFLAVHCIASIGCGSVAFRRGV